MGVIAPANCGALQRKQNQEYALWFFPRCWVLTALCDRSLGHEFDSNMNILNLFQQGSDAQLIRQTDDLKLKKILCLNDYHPQDVNWTRLRQ
jgi:hypothetical protein